MQNLVTPSITSYWQRGRKTRPASDGWIAGNAVCCHHRGETQDKRGRGGLHVNGDGSVAYACFNCNFRTRFQPGFGLSVNMKKLLSWMGVTENEIYRLQLDAFRLRDWMQENTPDALVQQEPVKVTFQPRALPDDAVPFTHYIEVCILAGKDPDPAFAACVDYVYGRRVDMQKYNLHWSPNLPDRVIVPYYWKDQIVGYTARAIEDKPLKYLNKNDTGYVFNIDKQLPNRKLVIVSEGTFDAMSVDGVAVLRSDVNDDQISIIESLNREIVVVPDNNKSGQTLIDRALEYHWSVAFPFWFEYDYMKDINDAVKRYGRLFTLKSILAAKESNRTKIQLLRKKIK